MIAKGTPHRDGAILARYLITGKDREHAELWELRGFACTGIVAAFRSVHIMAAATKCSAPFFHVSVRNREGEALEKSQWGYVADCIERILGLTDQPRAVAFHRALDTGHGHLHVAWSRIDQEKLTAKPLSFFKQRLKTVSRELEERLGLAPVPNERQSPIRFAPTRAEAEQARRLNLDVHLIRETIRGCLERSDSGRSFQTALGEQDLILARGDRRDFLVVDREGGIYALGKRILGISAGEIRSRCADLSPDQLPTVERARAANAANECNATPMAELAPQSNAPQVERSKTSSRASTPKQGRAAGKGNRTGDPRSDDHAPDVCQPKYEIPPRTAAPGQTRKIETAGRVPRRSDAQDARSEAPTPYQILKPDYVEPQNPVPEGKVHARRSLAMAPESLAKSAPPKPRSSAIDAVRRQFRVVLRHITHRAAPVPSPRRRKRDDRGGGFKFAALSLLRSAMKLPLLDRLDPAWEPFTWLRIWEYNDLASTSCLYDSAVSPPTSNHAPQL